MLSDQAGASSPPIAKSADEAQKEEHFRGLGKTGDESHHGRQDGANQDHRAPPEYVREIRSEQRSDHLSDEGRHADIAHDLGCEVHLVPDVGKRIADQREIQPVEERNETGKDQDSPVERRKIQTL